MKLIIGHLYPKIMNIYGDRGNIMTLVTRTQRRKIEIEVKTIEVGEKIPKDINLFFFGGGQDKEQIVAAEDLKGDKGKALLEALEEGCGGLFVCGGYQLIGRYYRPYKETELPGLGILDVATVSGDKRMIGNLLVKANNRLNFNGGLRTLVGFENHSGKTYLGDKVEPLGEVIIGHGNNGEDRTEGAYYKNTFGCYLHGPILPKNPHFADFLIKKALEFSSKEVVNLKTLNSDLEIKAHEAAIVRTNQTKA